MVVEVQDSGVSGSVAVMKTTRGGSHVEVEGQIVTCHEGMAEESARCEERVRTGRLVDV